MGAVLWPTTFCNILHDFQLQIQICRGVRPEIIDGTPECYKKLMQKCWHNDPDKRPNTATIIRTIEKWLDSISENDDSVWRISDKNRMVGESSRNETHPTHPQAVYSSRAFISCDSLEDMRIK